MPPPAPQYVELPALPVIPNANWSEGADVAMPFNVNIEEVRIGGQVMNSLVAVVAVLDGLAPLPKESTVAQACKLFSNGVVYRFQEEQTLPTKVSLKMVHQRT
jgi:hypothetical protein